MAKHDQGGAAPQEAVRSDREAADLRRGAADGEDRAIGLLPGVVNDLPEVAPHQWIYLMS